VEVGMLQNTHLGLAPKKKAFNFFVGLAYEEVKDIVVLRFHYCVLDFTVEYISS
jgi:hypothetical protein